MTANIKMARPLNESCIAICQMFLFSLVVTITFCGESIFKKSVSTVMYNYRWFILMLLNMLSFLCYLVILCVRKTVNLLSRINKKRMRKNRQLQNDLLSSHSSVDSDLISSMSSFVGIDQGTRTDKPIHAKTTYMNWRCHLIISLLDSLQMIFIFIPMGILPANIVMCVPLFGIVISAILQSMISFDSHNFIKLRCDNIIGLIALLCGILLLILKENALFLTDNTLNYDKKYISNLIIFTIGCILSALSDIYKRVSFSKIKICLIEHNVIQSTLTMIELLLLSPLAFQIQYISKYDNEYAHITNIKDSFGNLLNGIVCLFGTSSYDKQNVTDTCTNIAFKYPIFHFLSLVAFMSLNRISLNVLLQNGIYVKYVHNKTGFIQNLFSISLIISFLLCYNETIQDLWNIGTKNDGMYQVDLNITWETPIVAVLMFIGSLLINRRIDQRNVSMKSLEEQWIIT